MKIKSYYASSVEQAIQKARQELGTEAMLVTSRRAAAEARHLGAYEVVFGAPDSEVSPTPAATPRPPSKDLSAELQVLRAQLEDIKRVLQLNNARAQGSDPDIDELYRELTGADLDSSLVRKITDQVATLMAGSSSRPTIRRWDRPAAWLSRRVHPKTTADCASQ